MWWRAAALEQGAGGSAWQRIELTGLGVELGEDREKGWALGAAHLPHSRGCQKLSAILSGWWRREIPFFFLSKQLLSHLLFQDSLLILQFFFMKEKGHSNIWYNAGYVPCVLCHPHCSWCYGGLRMFLKFHRLEPALLLQRGLWCKVIWSLVGVVWFSGECCDSHEKYPWRETTPWIPFFHMALLSTPQCFPQC